MIKYICLKPRANNILNIEHRGNPIKVRNKIKDAFYPYCIAIFFQNIYPLLYVKGKKWGISTRKVGEKITIWRKYLCRNLREEASKTS